MRANWFFDTIGHFRFEDYSRKRIIVFLIKNLYEPKFRSTIRPIFSVFCCGGDCMEDLNLYLKDTLTERPQTRVPSADTVLRGYKGFDGYRPGRVHHRRADSLS